MKNLIKFDVAWGCSWQVMMILTGVVVTAYVVSHLV